MSDSLKNANRAPAAEPGGEPGAEHVRVVDRRWWAATPHAAQNAPAGTNETTGSDDAWQPGKPTYVEELERRLADKDRELQELVARYRDASREFEDGRARLRKELAKDVERARRSMLAEMLEVLDNLDRAIDAAGAAGSNAPLLEGIRLVHQLFLAKLKGLGVTRVDAAGAPFDPTRHEAITMVPATPEAPEGTIVGVIAPGYLIGDEVLRPASVAVAGPDAPAQAGG
jgi:molecular chaperone GrpE